MEKAKQTSKPNGMLKEQRLRRSWTQGQLAEKLGTTVMNVSRWERGIISPGLHFQQKLCELFQLNPPDLGLQSNENSHVEIPGSKIIDPALPLTLKNTSPIVGREHLLDQLIQDIVSGTRNIALTGLPGVGKTTMAVMLATHPTIQNYFSDGILWAGLGCQPHIITLLSRWGSLLNITPLEMTNLTTIDAWGHLLRDRIGSRRMLLILDDAWATKDALPFHLNGHQCRHILTTRFPTIAHTFASNHVYAVPELDMDESLILLQQFIPHACHTFPDEMIELIQRVGGLPLALTLIGRHLLTHTYTGQPRRIYQRLLQLIWNVNERLSVQQYPSPWEQASTIPFGSPLSLQGTIATSYNTLSSQAQLALRTIAIFPPKPQSFSEEAALSICLIETEMLDELVDSGLITYQAPNRYQIHQTISDALRLLPLDPNIERRFQNYFLSYLYQYQHNLDKIEQELTSITTALEMITGETAVETFLLHIQALVPFLETRSLYNLAYTLFTRLQTMVEQQNEAKYIEQSQYYFDLLNAWQRNLAQGAQHDANRRFHLKELVSGS